MTLVADVEHEPIARRVEYVVNGRDELDGAEARGQVPTGLRNIGQDGIAQLAGELLDLLLR